MKLADLLLDQTFVAGMGNKYKSELLFICKLNPFIEAREVSAEKREFLIKKIPDVLKFGYENARRTRPHLEKEVQNNWNFKHWVFRRAGKPYWICSSPIKFDRNASVRISFWCPNCQKDAYLSIRSESLYIVLVLRPSKNDHRTIINQMHRRQKQCGLF